MKKETIEHEIASLQKDLILCLQLGYEDYSKDIQKEINKKIKSYFNADTKKNQVQRTKKQSNTG